MKVLQILVLIIGFAFVANAQTTEKAVLTGTVYDQSGAVIPNINVGFINSEGEKFKSFTNEEGFYWIYLPKSKYEITFGNDNSGFLKYVVKDYILASKMQLDVALKGRSSDECGLAGCFGDTPPIELESRSKAWDKFLQTRPLEKLPKEQNKSKRKKKINKQ
ncbi:MAG TPA: carboxypeptidase-like regulatory domain-containing protein [Pyrinomonadaceae bacterium]|jgi:hypothetical protein